MGKLLELIIKKKLIRIENEYIKLPKIGFVNLFLHGIIKSNEIIKNVAIEKDTDNKYYISAAVECLDIKNNNKTRDDKNRCLVLT